MKNLIFIVLFMMTQFIKAQTPQFIPSLMPPAQFENIYSQKIGNDSLTSSFVIWVKNEVKLHKHVTHSENLYILEGTCVFRLGDATFDLKGGDYIFIPKNTAHSLKVTSILPLKVMSFQSPMFDGTDRVKIDEK